MQLIKKAKSEDSTITLDLNDVIEYIGDTIPPLFQSSIPSQSIGTTNKEISEFPLAVRNMFEKILLWMTGKRKFEVCKHRCMYT